MLLAYGSQNRCWIELYRVILHFSPHRYDYAIRSRHEFRCKYDDDDAELPHAVLSHSV